MKVKDAFFRHRPRLAAAKVWHGANTLDLNNEFALETRPPNDSQGLSEETSSTGSSTWSRIEINEASSTIQTIIPPDQGTPDQDRAVDELRVFNISACEVAGIFLMIIVPLSFLLFLIPFEYTLFN